MASKSQRRFLSVLYVNEEGMAVPVEVDQEKIEIFDSTDWENDGKDHTEQQAVWLGSSL